MESAGVCGCGYVWESTAKRFTITLDENHDRDLYGCYWTVLLFSIFVCDDERN